MDIGIIALIVAALFICALLFVLYYGDLLSTMSVLYPKYKTNDKVKIRNDLKLGQYIEGITLTKEMVKHLGKIVTITEWIPNPNCNQGFCYYVMENKCLWNEEMFEPKFDYKEFIRRKNMDFKDFTPADVSSGNFYVMKPKCYELKKGDVITVSGDYFKNKNLICKRKIVYVKDKQIGYIIDKFPKVKWYNPLTWHLLFVRKFYSIIISSKKIDNKNCLEIDNGNFDFSSFERVDFEEISKK